MTTKLLTYAKILRDIQRQNYIEVPFPMSQEALHAVAGDFLKFLALPQEVKNAFTVMADARDRGSNAGYADKKIAKGDSDNKEYFNYRGVTQKLLRQIALQKHGSNPVVTQFLQSARNVHREAALVLAKIVYAIDRHHPGIYHKIFSRNAARYLCLRFVKYDPAKPGEFLATAHYDRGSCALALAESAPGLRVGRGESSLQEVIRCGNTAIFMPAYTFPKDIGSDLFPPAWHDVVQKSHNLHNATIARWAMILFADVVADDSISYTDTHTPQHA